MQELSAILNYWQLEDNIRRYAVVTLPFKEASEIFKPNVYLADTGEGEQRQQCVGHINRIAKDIKADKFTPTAVAVGMSDKTTYSLEQKGEVIYVTIQLNNTTLPLLDGHQRFASIQKLIDAGVKAAENFPITALIHLDNRNKENFLNAQKGRPVDKAHMFSLQANTGAFKDNVAAAAKLALEIAQLLNEDKESPFYRFIKFDSRGIAPLPVSTLCSKNPSDLATSLVGTAKIAILFGKDAAWAAKIITDTFTAFTTYASSAPSLKDNNVLTPPPNGSRGSATMIIGVTNLVAYHVASTPDLIDGRKIVEAIGKVFKHRINGNFAGPKKRKLMKALLEEYFKDVPIELLKCLSYSTFAMKKPKPVRVEASVDETIEEPPLIPAGLIEEDDERAPWEGESGEVDES